MLFASAYPLQYVSRGIAKRIKNCFRKRLTSREKLQIGLTVRADPQIASVVEKTLAQFGLSETSSDEESEYHEEETNTTHRRSKDVFQPSKRFRKARSIEEEKKMLVNAVPISTSYSGLRRLLDCRDEDRPERRSS
ncbi:hypothetical protein QZH41_010332 [Actinostola sp. cb2023]|nr:hypothetical protein QZH41_010332 [Actinostola sp. cb2023]